MKTISQMIVQVFINEETQCRLDQIAAELAQKPQELVQAAVDEMARDYFRGRKDDPASKKLGENTS